MHNTTYIVVSVAVSINEIHFSVLHILKLFIELLLINSIFIEANVDSILKEH